jgi:HSP20 family molecular chaperone IbpA
VATLASWRGAKAKYKELPIILSRHRGRGFYDPLSEVNRLFGGIAERTGDGQRAQVSGWTLAIDMLQKDEDLVVRVELPGA